MGTQKLLLPFAGTTMIGHIVSQVLRSPDEHTVVVVGSGGAAVGAAVEEFDLFDNLMVDCGIRASGGVLELGEVPPEDRWRDLASFTRCVEKAARILRGG